MPKSWQPVAGRGHALVDVAAVVLAAGLSRRMGAQNKLLLSGASGRAMVTQVVDTLLASKVASVWVVVGHQAEHIAAALAPRPVRLVHAPDYEAGIAASLARGIEALPKEVRGALVCLGDMPTVSVDVIDGLLDAYEPDGGSLIVVATHAGRRGNPVLWDRRFFADILALKGDRGARGLLQRHEQYVGDVEVNSPSVLTDFDTPDTLSGLT